MKLLFRPAIILTIAWAVLALRSSSAQGPKKPLDEKTHFKNLLDQAEEEYRRFFKKPEKPIEFWAAMKHELEVGKFELAALHLKLMLDPPPALKIAPEDIDKALVQVEELNGMFAFLRLRHIKKWSDFAPFQREGENNVELLIERATSAVDKHLSDPKRINKFINNLEARTVEERTFAYYQIKRSKERATPYLVEKLRTTVGKAINGKVREAMVVLDPEIVPPFLEVLKARDEKDAASVDLRVTLLEIIKRRGDKRAIPYLWHLSAWPKYPQEVRDRALGTLAHLLGTAPERLPPAKVALTELAERYYQHKVKFVDPKRIRVWPWDGASIATEAVTISATQAEEYFGLRYAQEALQLDPNYQPAQMVFFNLSLDRNLPPLKNLLFEKLPPNMHRLLATLDADLLIAALERAMQDRNLPIVLTTIQALGERGELKAALSPGTGPPRGIIKALYYPDRRVQFAAMTAMLRMPKSTTPVASGRIVELLSRYTASDPVSRLLLAHFPADKVAEYRKIAKDAGFEPEVAGAVQAKAGPVDVAAPFKMLNASADFDAIMIHHAAGAELAHAVAQLRADPNHGFLPILVIAPPGREDFFKRQTERYRNVQVITELQSTMPQRIKEHIESGTREYAGLPLTQKERQLFTTVALNELWRMARGEVVGYDIKPALEAIQKAALNDDLAVQAIEILGRTPGVDIQRRLAAVLLDQGRGKIRMTAAVELNRHIQKYGVSLTNLQVKDIRAAHVDPREPPEMRAQLAVMVGNLRGGAVTTGDRLLQFRPDPPPQPKKQP